MKKVCKSAHEKESTTRKPVEFVLLVMNVYLRKTVLFKRQCPLLCLGAEKRIRNKLNPHTTTGPGIESGTHWSAASALITAPSLLPLPPMLLIEYSHCSEDRVHLSTNKRYPLFEFLKSGQLTRSEGLRTAGRGFFSAL